jgi:DNA-binding NarL/FixJ family response regulator
MSGSQPIRVLIAGQDNAFRAELGRLLGDNSRIEVIAHADSTQEAIALALAHHPDLVLMDMAIRGTNGLAATRALKEQRPTIPVILFTILSEQEYLSVARYSGVDRCLNKRDIERKLMPVIDSLITPAPIR